MGMAAVWSDSFSKPRCEEIDVSLVSVLPLCLFV